ncbi:unnamed protein product [Merluccius merluccius]
MTTSPPRGGWLPLVTRRTWTHCSVAAEECVRVSPSPDVRFPAKKPSGDRRRPSERVHMGCGTSRTTAVEPLRRSESRRDQDDDDDVTSKLGSRGDSAVSKVTADSGVVMERQDPSLPGAVPGKIPPPLTGSPAGLLQDQGSPAERPPSSEIMEQLLSQGIIPVGPPRERSSGSGEAYNIMLDDGEVARRRPPARLESLKERKEQRSPSRDSIDHKMQRAEERRKQKEDELKTRLRTKSARVRAPAAEPEDADPKEDPPLSTPVTAVTPDPRARTQVREDGRGETEGSERGERDSPGEGREAGEEKEEREDRKKKKKDEGGGGGGGGEDDRGREEENREDREEGREEEDGEDGEEGRLGGGGGGGEREGGDGGPSQDERLKLGQLLMSSGELESDPSFQNTDDMF